MKLKRKVQKTFKLKKLISLWRKMLTFLVISLALFNNVSPASQHGTNRKTIYGWIRGKVTSRVPGLKVEEYLGVPYALPPIGHFRFKVRILFYTF